VSFKEFNKKMDREFNSGYPSSFKDKVLTDKTIEMKHTFYGGDRPYDEFWFERTNRFSESPDDNDLENDDELEFRYPTTVLSKEVNI
jgi:hypothetical protein